jgi:hypothetical protein
VFLEVIPCWDRNLGRCSFSAQPALNFFLWGNRDRNICFHNRLACQGVTAFQVLAGEAKRASTPDGPVDYTNHAATAAPLPATGLEQLHAGETGSFC